jgi:hypothetical protein
LCRKFVILNASSGANGSLLLSFIERTFCRNYEVGGTRSTRERDERCIQDFGCEYLKENELGRPRCRWDNNVTIDL